MRRELFGGWVQRVSVAEAAGRQVAHLTVRVDGETQHVLLAAGLGLGTMNETARAKLRSSLRGGPSAVQAHCRARIQGGRVVWASTNEIAIERDGHTWRLDGKAAGALALEETDETTPSDPARSVDPGSLDAAGARMVSCLAEGGLVEERARLQRALAKASSRVTKRIDAVRGDLARIGSADELARAAQLFVVAAAHSPRGATRLTAVDWSSAKPRNVEMTLDPSRDARSQIDALFARARRLKDGAAIAQGRLAEAERTLLAIAAVATALETTEEPVDALVARARAAAPRDFRLEAIVSGTTRAPKQARALPYRTFLGVSGLRILVGRGAAHNDALTLSVARPHDLWLHAKGRAGAHVVVPLKKGASCPADVLVEAAHLAAHFSDARGEAVVDVQYTPRRYVRKPRGSPAGLVVVDREKVLALRERPDVLKALLDREVRAEA